MWKYNENDLIERKLWDEYMDAYEAAFENCSKYGEWEIVPADQNWYIRICDRKKGGGNAGEF
jgi:polyphosphate kinase 2 (PPK2 family)